MKRKLTSILQLFILCNTFIFGQLAEFKNDIISTAHNQIVDIKIKYIGTNGDVIHAGYVYNDINGDGANADLDTKDPIVYRTDICGNVLWKTVFHKPSGGEFRGLIIAQNGEIVCAGYTSNGQYVTLNSKNFDTYSDQYAGLLVRINPSNGNVIWQTEFVDQNTSTHGEAFFDVCELQDGSDNLIVCGGRDYRPGTVDMLTAGFTSAGSFSWSKSYPNIGSDLLVSITNNGTASEAIACGHINNNGAFNSYLGIVLHLNSTGITLSMNAYNASPTFESFMFDKVENQNDTITLSGIITNYSIFWVPLPIHGVVFNLNTTNFAISGSEIFVGGGGTADYYFYPSRIGANDYVFCITSNPSIFNFNAPPAGLNSTIGRITNGVLGSWFEINNPGPQVLTCTDAKAGSNQFTFGGINRDAASISSDAFKVNWDISFSNVDCSIGDIPLFAHSINRVPFDPGISANDVILILISNSTIEKPLINTQLICGACDPPEPNQDDCSDTCYWKVTGNNIIGGNNRFGTLSNDDVEITTNGVGIGIITSASPNVSDARWGMGLMAPKAKLHVHNDDIWGNGHIDVTGKSPGIKFYGGPIWSTTGGRIGLSTSSDDYTLSSQPDDFIIQNWSNHNSLIFGTSNNGSDGFERMRIDNIGQVGINTVNSGPIPTAFLHVNCSGNNPDDGSATTSDVRFENLEPGDGNILLINSTGYVFDSKITVADFMGLQQKFQEEQEKSEVLTKKLEELNEKLSQLSKNLDNLHSSKQFNNGASPLLHVSPNPTKEFIIVDYFVEESANDVSIIISDEQGKELITYPVVCHGNCKANLRIPIFLTSNLVFIQLIADGLILGTEKVVVIK